ncbi:hypothetical protein [Micromonospora sp. NPDC005113]
MSLLEKAERLTVRARTYSEGAKERDERIRIGNALGDVGRALTDLASAVDSYVAAREAGVPVTGLRAPTDLVNTSGEGLPSSRSLVAAKGRAASLTAGARDAVSAQWRDWAQGELEAANLGRISRLGLQHRRQAEELHKRMRAAANAKQVQAQQITAFCQDFDALEKMLASIREDDPVVLLLNRIRRGPMTLADLNDAEIDMLRADDSVASQVFLETK